MSIACVLVVSEARVPLVRDEVLPSVLAQGFDEVLWVGDGARGAGYRYLPVPAFTRTTTDALVKRDVGTVAAHAETIVYLCDDHRLHPTFGTALRAVLDDDWDVLVPSRWRAAHGYDVPLNNGRAPALPSVADATEAVALAQAYWRVPATAGYCAGHAGVFRRRVVMERPWAAMPHGPLWDFDASLIQQAAGFRFTWEPTVRVYDIDPAAAPWR